jgi:mono/diheme cytochrome c family protein/hydrogenase/urease accessory protein HupE
MSCAPGAATAHEIPARVALTGYVVPDGARVRVALRLPLAALRDTDFPLRPDGSLDLDAANPRIAEGIRTWVISSLTLEARGDTLRPWRLEAWRVAAPGDAAFASWASARASLDPARQPATLPADGLRWQDAWVDVLLDVSSNASADALVFTPAVAHLGVRTVSVLTVVLPDGREQPLRFAGNPGPLSLDPSPVAAALRFVQEGVTHIWGGLDHLLFVLCLVLPVRGWRPLVALVTSFTVAHSITLAAAALGFVPTAAWFPPLVEVVIAASIVWMAIENAVRKPQRLAARWPVAFAFGLVHGFGFAFALGDALQFAGRHTVMALAAFNVGVELGQLAVLAAAIPVLSWLTRPTAAPSAGITRERAVILTGSLLIGHTAWHWMTDRITTFRTYEISVPSLDATFALAATRVAFVAVLALTAAWLLRRTLQALRLTPTTAPTVPLLVALLCASLPLRPAVTTAQQPRRTTDGVYTQPQAQRGKDVFAGACQSCHDVNAHAGPAFRTNWTGRTLGALFEFLKASMPKSDPGTLSDTEYTDVMAFLLRQNRMPVGSEPLAPDPAMLSQILFDTTTAAPPHAPSRRR